MTRILTRIAVVCAAALLGAFAAAAPAPGKVPAPMLSWADDPPAVEVRALSASRRIKVRYGAFAPATFHAELDGDDVSALFHPEPGKDEVVELPFVGGRNRLSLQVSSVDELEHITLYREIAFARMPQDAAAGERLHSAPELKHELWQRETPEKAPVTVPAATPATKPAATPPTK